MHRQFEKRENRCSIFLFQFLLYSCLMNCNFSGKRGTKEKQRKDLKTTSYLTGSDGVDGREEHQAEYH